MRNEMKNIDVKTLQNGSKFSDDRGLIWFYVGINPITGQHIATNEWDSLETFEEYEMFEEPREIELVCYILISKDGDGVYEFGGNTYYSEEIVNKMTFSLIM
jgi:hypothetical protein